MERLFFTCYFLQGPNIWSSILQAEGKFSNE